MYLYIYIYFIFFGGGYAWQIAWMQLLPKMIQTANVCQPPCNETLTSKPDIKTVMPNEELSNMSLCISSRFKIRVCMKATWFWMYGEPTRFWMYEKAPRFWMYPRPARFTLRTSVFSASPAKKGQSA